MLDVIISLVSLILGIFISLFIGNFMITLNKRREMTDIIKDIFIEDLERIRKLESNKNDEANRITISNINRTDFLIRKFFRYIGKGKRKKIESHYNEYKEPYKLSPTDIDPFNAFPSDENIIYPDTYGFKQIPNAIERTKEFLNFLIDDL